MDILVPEVSISPKSLLMNADIKNKINRNQHCPCGSGKKYKKCCGASDSPVNVAGAGGLFARAQADLQAGRLQPAIATYKKILLERPDHADAIHYLGVALHMSGNDRDAEPYLQQSLALKPHDSMYWNNAGLFLQDRNDLRGAERHFRAALDLAPDNREAACNLVDVLLLREQGWEALENLETIMAVHGDEPELQEFRIRALKLLSKYNEALRCCEELMQSYPERRSVKILYADIAPLVGRYKEAEAILSGLNRDSLVDFEIIRRQVLLAEGQGNLEKAAQYLVPALDKASGLPEKVQAGVYRLQARLCRLRGDMQVAQTWLDKIRTEETDTTENMLRTFEIAQVREGLALYDEAFEAWCRANWERQQLDGVEYSRENMQQRMARLKRITAAVDFGKLAEPPRGAQAEQAQPIFILGFPRSGTTLIEQILSVHAQVEAGDELPFLAHIENMLADMTGGSEPYPECLVRINDGNIRDRVLDQARNYYQEGVRNLGVIKTDSGWFTDKTPFNSERLGLIHLLFPSSPVLHVVRHPLDACLSTFFTNFSKSHWYSHGLLETAVYFREIHELVAHYTAAIPGMRIRRIRYEDVVTHTEYELRELLSWLGLEYDPACLQFSDSRRIARTASYAQVRQKLYSTSMYRYRNYRKHVESIIPVLKPVIDELGYSVEV